LRKQALAGDALSHAALPGLCVAFLLVGEKNLPAMLLGAFGSGVLGLALVPALKKWTRIKEDAALGIVLSVFFGLGVVLSKFIQNSTTTGNKAGLESYILGETAGMIAQDVYLIGGVSLVILATILLLYKEFRLVAFNPEFATIQGWPTYWLHLLLMVLVAVTVVIGLPAVGVVMMTALLVLPAAAARFWTEQLNVMLGAAAGFGVAMGVLGTALSAQYSFLKTGPTIVLAGLCLFLFSVLFAPRRGGLARLLAHWRFQRKLAEQTLLRLLFDLTEPALPQLPALTLQDLERIKPWQRSQLRRSVRRARKVGLLETAGADSFRLTATGWQRAAHVTRNYRSWELFLVEYADLAGNVVDLDAESLEVHLPEDVVGDLEAKLRAAGRLPLAPPQAPPLREERRL
jgi:manganese/zinc/iron transport system permease protein